MEKDIRIRRTVKMVDDSYTLLKVEYHIMIDGYGDKLNHIADALKLPRDYHGETINQIAERCGILCTEPYCNPIILSGYEITYAHVEMAYDLPENYDKGMTNAIGYIMEKNDDMFHRFFREITHVLERKLCWMKAAAELEHKIDVIYTADTE